jgi:hypothetical protein
MNWGIIKSITRLIIIVYYKVASYCTDPWILNCWLYFRSIFSLHSANLHFKVMTCKLCAYFILFILVLKMNPFRTVEQNNVRMSIRKMSYVVRMEIMMLHHTLSFVSFHSLSQARNFEITVPFFRQNTTLIVINRLRVPVTVVPPSLVKSK